MTIKQTSKIRTLIIALLVALTFSGCSNFLQPPLSAPGGNGLLTVKLAGELPRTIMPQEPLFSKVSLEFSAPGESTITVPDAAAQVSGGGYVQELVPGMWTVKATAYQKIDDIELVIAEGSSSPTQITSGTPAAPVTITLIPSTTAGDGFFTYHISLSSDPDLIGVSGTITLTPSAGGAALTGLDGQSLNFGTPVTVQVPAGMYDMVISLENAEGKRTGIVETVHIYSGLESKALYVDGDSDTERNAVTANWFTGIIMLAGNVMVTNPNDILLSDDITIKAYQESARTTLIGTASLPVASFESGISEWVMAVAARDMPSGSVYFTVTASDGTNTFTNVEGDSGGAVPVNGKAGIALVITAVIPETGFRYITQNGAGAKTGLSWASASDDLQKMMDELAALGDTGTDKVVYIGAGTYIPKYLPGEIGTYDTSGFDPRDWAFMLRAGVDIRGGHTAVGEDISETQRKGRFDANGVTSSQYQAVLSGDLNGNGIDDNDAYHVVVGIDIPNDGKTILDGLTITGGGSGISNSNSSPVLTNVSISGNYAGGTGGGVNNSSSSPVLTNVTISDNRSGNGGGGMYNEYSSPVLTNVIISNNTAEGDHVSANGGGMYNLSSSPILTNVTISGNITADAGGGMYNDFNSSPSLTNVTILGNAAYDGGGMCNFSNSSPSLTNVTILGNAAYDGGGIYNERSSPILTNVTISGNAAIGNEDSGGLGGGIYNSYNSSPKIRNSIIWGNSSGIYNDDTYGVSTPIISFSDIQDWASSGTNNNIDPLIE